MKDKINYCNIETCNLLYERDINIYELEQKNKILEKALEIMCENVNNYCEKIHAGLQGISLKDYIIRQAKQELEEKDEK